jgi:hypothetical protein
MTKKQIYIASGVVVAGVATYMIYQAINSRIKKDKNVNEGKETEHGGGTLVGKTVNYLPSNNFVNVRTSPKVDSWGGGDWGTNLLGKVTTNPVGKIKSQTLVDSYFWYEISLNTPIKGQLIGYVREDAVKVI